MCIINTITHRIDCILNHQFVRSLQFWIAFRAIQYVDEIIPIKYLTRRHLIKGKQKSMRFNAEIVQKMKTIFFSSFSHLTRNRICWNFFPSVRFDWFVKKFLNDFWSVPNGLGTILEVRSCFDMKIEILFCPNSMSCRSGRLDVRIKIRLLTAFGHVQTFSSSWTVKQTLKCCAIWIPT